MKSKLSLILFIIMIISSCSEKNPDPAKWTDDEINTWFEKKEWLNGWNIQPDESVNKRNFAIYYHKNPNNWQQAFQFLKSSNLKELPLGKQVLDGDHLFATVSEYCGKQRQDALFESHRKYIDIQYVAEGEELIGLTTLDKVTVKEPYSDEKDIAFYDFDGGEYIKATNEKFFLFFPEDAHRPSITTGDSILVRKIVVKVMVE